MQTIHADRVHCGGLEIACLQAHCHCLEEPREQFQHPSTSLIYSLPESSVQWAQGWASLRSEIGGEKAVGRNASSLSPEQYGMRCREERIVEVVAWWLLI